MPTAPPRAVRGRRGVSLFHLYGLRILFFLIALFLLSTIGPRLLEPPPTLMTGAARALFTALGLLAALGVRYPLQMLPVMMFEFAWKALVDGLHRPAALGRRPPRPGGAQTFFEARGRRHPGRPIVIAVALRVGELS